MRLMARAPERPTDMTVLAIPGGPRNSRETSGVCEEVPSSARIENQGLTGNGSNRIEADAEKENPGALAGATGANSIADMPSRCYSERDSGATVKARPGRDHTRASRAIGWALMAGYEVADNWGAVSDILRLRLSKPERAVLAWAALRSLDRDQAAATAEAAFPDAGMPVKLLGGIMEEATFWAGKASAPERDAYALACFQAMPAARQRAFLDHVAGRRAG